MFTAAILALTLLTSPPADAPSQKPSDSKPQAPAPKPKRLSVGAMAPAMSTDRVIKGEDVKTFEKGKVYVLEFWATWCAPCIKAIPHLTKLQKDNPELTIIGVAGAERAPTEEARFSKAKEFVDKQGDKMAYTVLYDGDNSMWTEWMAAAGKGGIPCSFVVDGDGKVSYIGHPEGGLDEAVASAIKRAKSASKKRSSTDDKSKS